MKKRKTLIAIVFLIISYENMAQITQLELASGLKKTDFTAFSLRPLAPKARFSIATLSFFQKYHQRENFMFDEGGVHSTFYWNVNESIAIGPGLYYNSVAGFSERVSILYTIQSPNFVLTTIPTVAHAEETGFINGELFILMQLTRPLNEYCKLLLSTQMLTTWDKFTHHARSFQQIRVGLDKQATQFGLAIDLDQYGDKPIARTSLGVFVRKIFLNN